MTDARTEFNISVRQSVRNTVRETTSPLEAVSRTVDIAEWLLDELSKHDIQGLDRIACRAGCAWCCYQQVGITAAQALHIAQALRSGDADVTLDETLARIAALDDRIRGLSARDRLKTGLPCAFLKNDRCMIYAVRPFACRGANSVDAEFCRRTVEDTDPVEAEWQRTGGQEWIHAAPFEAMQAVQEGLRDGLTDAGLPDERLELTAAVRIALETPDAEQRWRDGEDIFAPARLP